MIEYRNGNLFDATGQVVLAHACNCQGRWGSGIAKHFAQRFPLAYQKYQARCRDGVSPGHAFVLESPGELPVGVLLTSSSYGARVDPPEKIVAATHGAALMLIKYVEQHFPEFEIHSPKINAGLFNVPWEQTAEVLEHLLWGRAVKWVVWTL
jgi:ADP-ribose 1''-phosphate phosphatase